MKTTIIRVTCNALPVCAFALLALSRAAQGVSPPPDGGYPGGNTAEGQNALFSLTTGGYNTAVGFLSLRQNSSNSLNTAVGAGTLLANSADSNTAVGAGTLLANTTGSENTANGAFALFSNTSGPFNTADGANALLSNTTGGRNTAVGDGALLANTTGSTNTAVGVSALRNNSTGVENVAVGFDALLQNTNGEGNVAVGWAALAQNTSGLSNTAVGVNAGMNVNSANNVICLGSPGENVDNSCYIGNIYGAPIDPATGTLVAVDSTGKLGTTSSSQRFKRDIQPMDKSSEAILKLNPVTFHYKSDPKNVPCYGLIAEKVADVSPDLVIRDKEGKPYSVRYDQVNAMLLNEFLKEHRKVENLEAALDAVNARLKKQEAGLREMRAVVAVGKSRSHLASRD